MVPLQVIARSATEKYRRFYVAITGAILAFVVLALVLEKVGIAPRVSGFLMIGVSLAVFVSIGIGARTLQVAEFYVAGRAVPAVFNGMALAATSLGGVMILSLAGILYYGGFSGLYYLIGWLGGLLLLAVLIAPFLRKFGAYTVPDFLAARFGGSLARLLGIGVLFAASAVFLVALLHLGGLLIGRLLGVEFAIGVSIIAGVTVLSCVFGGMRAVTRIQIVQYIILAVALLVPAVLILIDLSGVPVGQLLIAPTIDAFPRLDAAGELAALGASTGSAPPLFNPVNAVALIFVLALGTASLPHILMRTFTSANVSGARRSVGWGLFFVGVVFAALPVYAAIAKYSVLNEVVGRNIGELPQWVGRWVEAGMMRVVDRNADGLVALNEFFMRRDAVLLAAPEMAGLPLFFTDLLVIGGLAAILATASGLLLALANAVSHDFYYRIVDPLASTARRLVIARLLLIVVAVLAAWAATQRPADIMTLMAWSFSLAAAGNFPALVLGIWWKRCTRQGAVAGMLAGFGVALAYLLGTTYAGWTPWFGIDPVLAGVFGVPAGFATMIAVSVMTRAPSGEIDRLVDDIRAPRGESYTERERLEERAREAGLGT